MTRNSLLLSIVLVSFAATSALAGKPPPPSPDYPLALWVPAASTNYTKSDRPNTYPINYWITHVVQGSYAGCISWFQNRSSKVSSHYVCRSSDGEITQMVHHKDVAWHAGNWDYNTWSIGTEHEGYVDNTSWFTGNMYTASGALSNWCADHTTIQKDRAHILGHSEVPGATHTDPGVYWNWDFNMSRIVPPEGANLALNAVGYQESGHNEADQTGDMAFDGVWTTKWCEVNNPNNHWLAIDLGAGKSINTFIVGHASLGAEYGFYNTNEFYLYTGDSYAGPWTEQAHVVNSNDESANVITLPSPVAARYVKIWVVNSGDPDPYVRIPEVEIWGE